MTPGAGRRWGRGVAAALVLGSVGAGEAGGQDLWSDVHAAGDGYVRFEYEARPGACGNGDGASVRLIAREGWRAANRARPCEEAPVRIELRLFDGVVQDLDVHVGGAWRARSRATVDLGRVEPDRAADLLFRIAESSVTRAAERALFPATIGRDVRAWPRLLSIARGGAALPDVRRQAVFWLGQEAGERATEGLVSIIEDESEIEVREHAIFALSQRDEPGAVEALIHVARENPEPILRRRAIFWLGQRGDDPRVIDFLEEILRGDG